MYTKCEKKKVCVRERQREGEGGGGRARHIKKIFVDR